MQDLTSFRYCYRYGEESVYIKKRKGFIKYALRYGYRVHPVYSFGENDTYYTFHWFPKTRMMLNKYKIPAILFFGFPGVRACASVRACARACMRVCAREQEINLNAFTHPPTQRRRPYNGRRQGYRCSRGATPTFTPSSARVSSSPNSKNRTRVGRGLVLVRVGAVVMLVLVIVLVFEFVFGFVFVFVFDFVIGLGLRADVCVCM